MIVYDTNISEDISLSKILDAFIIDNEKSNIIITFLKQHDSYFSEIINNSLYYTKLFQLDFILSCKNDDIKYLIEKLSFIRKYDVALFIWQILKSNAGKLNNIKYTLRTNLYKHIDGSFKHPYYLCDKKIEQFDQICFKYIERNNSIIDILCSQNGDNLIQFFDHLNNSLFKTRLIQYDFISNLSDKALYVFLKNVYNLCNNNIHRINLINNFHIIKIFTLQILDSNINNEIKKYCFNQYKKIINNHISIEASYNINLETIDIIDIINDSKSFSELMLKMTISNYDITQYSILYLMTYKMNWLKEWVTYDKDNLNSYLNVSDFIITLK